MSGPRRRPEVEVEQPARAIPRRTGSSGRWLRLVGVGLILTAGAALVWALTAPGQVEEAYGRALEVTQRPIVDAMQAFSDDPVRSVVLGADGDESTLDRCDGTFTRMLAYEAPHDDLPPVWAAHNHCGGDVILSWNVGDRVAVHDNPEDPGRVFEVTEIQYAPKYDGDVSDIEGIGGELLLQTCYYRPDSRIKFVALSPVSGSAQTTD